MFSVQLIEEGFIIDMQNYHYGNCKMLEHLLTCLFDLSVVCIAYDYGCIIYLFIYSFIYLLFINLMWYSVWKLKSHLCIVESDVIWIMWMFCRNLHDYKKSIKKSLATLTTLPPNLPETPSSTSCPTAADPVEFRGVIVFTAAKKHQQVYDMPASDRRWIWNHWTFLQ